MESNKGTTGRVMVVLGALIITTLFIGYIQTYGDNITSQGQTDLSGVFIIPASILVFAISLLVLLVIQNTFSKGKNKK